MGKIAKQGQKTAVRYDRPAGCLCVESSCGRGLSENDSREVSCGSCMKCLEYDVKDFDMIF